MPLNNVGDLLYFTQVPDGSSEHFLARAELTEGLSQLFSYHLTIQTRTGRPDGKTWIGQPIAFAVMGAMNAVRMCAGQVRSFEVQYQNKLYCDFTVEVVPALFTTQLSRNSRIFQKMDVLQVIKQVLKDYPNVIVEDKCKGSYPKRDYLLQYRETDFDFVSRLMEEEGIYYYFKYADGAGRYKHKLILANDVSSYFDGTPPKMSYQRSDVGLTIQQIATNYSSLTAKRTTRAYDYLVPPKNLQVETPSKIPWADKGTEKYDYPGWYLDAGEGKRQGALFMEEQEAWSVVLHGSTNYPDVVSGGVHEIADDQLTPSHKKVVIISTHHSIADPSAATGEPSWHQCSFTAMPSDIAFRPRRTLPHPVIPGTQRAVVVGPKGNEIYTDEHGRIKVQFMWDREGKKDENSTCWIRMMQQWAGPGYGAQWIPRIGHEVLVSFLEGDPDQPVVVGSLYNGANKVPFELNGRETQSGWRTVSSKGKGKRQEFIFEDKAGSEEIYMYTGRNHRLVVDEDESNKIGKNQANNIGANQSTEVGGNRDIKVTGDQKTDVKGNIDLIAMQDVRASAAAGTVKYSMSNGSFVLEAAMSMTLKAGASSISIGPAGISIAGAPTVTITGSPMVMINSGGGGGGSASAAQKAKVQAVLDKLADRKLKGAEGAWTDPRKLGSGAPAPKAPVKTGLGNDVDALAAKSPTLQKQLEELQKDGWKIVYGKPGGGSFADRSTKTITLDPNGKGDTAGTVQTLAHEAGHAKYPYVPDESSRDKYVKGALADEGAATLNNIKVQREINDAGGPDIGIAGNTANHKAYNDAFDQFKKDGDEAKARDTIGGIFGKGEKTSNTNQPYEEYYGSDYDKRHPPKKP